MCEEQEIYSKLALNYSGLVAGEFMNRTKLVEEQGNTEVPMNGIIRRGLNNI